MWPILTAMQKEKKVKEKEMEKKKTWGHGFGLSNWRYDFVLTEIVNSTNWNQSGTYFGAENDERLNVAALIENRVTRNKDTNRNNNSREFCWNSRERSQENSFLFFFLVKKETHIYVMGEDDPVEKINWW